MFRPGRDQTTPVSLPVRLLHSLLAALLVVGTVVLPTPPVADADGHPNISLGVDIPSTTLHGADTNVTLTASNPGGPHGYNASFIATLDSGVSYVGTSGSVAPRVEANDSGQVVLYWENVADLLTGASTSVSFTIRANPTVHGIGANPGLTAGVYANSDPRNLADFAKTGLVDEQAWEVTGGYTSWDTAAATTNIVPFIITKSEPSPEGELLRGVHHQKTVYSVTVTNNPTGPSTGFVIDDYLPAGLEFLGCVASDNSLAGTEEYPGSGRIDDTGHPSVTNCHEPSLVNTVQNPPGLPSGIYTHLRWTASDLGGDSSLGAGESFTMSYAVAVPLRANALFDQYPEPNPQWDPAKALECVANPDYDSELPTENPAFIAQVEDPEGAECVANPDYDSELPTENPEFVANPAFDPEYDPDTPEFIFVDPPTDGFQGSNLDNNTGPLTTDEQNLTSRFNLNGSYGGGNYDSSNTFTNTAENLAIWKEASHDNIFHGAATTWTIHLRTGEYVVSTGTIALVDEVPDGLTPSNPSHGGTIGGGGPYTIIWPLAGRDQMGPNETTAVTFTTSTQTNYGQGSQPPVSTGDSWVNRADVVADVTFIADGDGSTGFDLNTDHTETGQSAGGITISKQVATPSPGQTCGDGAGLSWAENVDAGPGDRVCWRLAATFPTALATPNFTPTDFLPAGFTLEDIKEGVNHTATGVDVESFTADGRRIDWAPSDIGPGGQVFEAIVDTVLDDPSQLDSGEDVLGNLFKVYHTNTSGQVFQYRDEAQVSQASPVLVIEKQVAAVNGNTTGLPADGATVRAGDEVTYTLEITNEGSGPASVVDVLDVLAPQFTCSQVTGFTLPGPADLGACLTDSETGQAMMLFNLYADSSGGEWDLVGPGDSVVVSYTVEIHAEVAPNEMMVNEAGIVDYFSLTNTADPNDGPEFFEYSPANPICGHPGIADPGLVAFCDGGEVNVPEARDTAALRTPNVTVAKSRTTDIVDPGFNTAAQATIGEAVSYTVTVTIPHGTTVWDGEITDPINSRHTLVGTPTATLNGGPLPPEWNLQVVGSQVRLDMGESHQNPTGSGNDIVVLTFAAVVDDVAANSRTGSAISNTARFNHTTQGGSGLPQVTASVSTQIVEPNLAISKTVMGDTSGVVQPGQFLSYTLTVSNVSATRASRAHNLMVVDDVPADLTVLPASISGTGSLVAGDVVWQLGDLAPGQSVELNYEAQVANPILNSSVLTNTASAIACSIAAPSLALCADEGGRSYLTDDEVTVSAVTATVHKAVDKVSATVGEVLTYTLTYTMPAGVTGFDYLLRDQLDSDLVLLEVVSSECLDGCNLEVVEFYHDTDSGELFFFFGDQLASTSEDRVFEITYTATPGPGASDGASLGNTASLWFSPTDEVDDGDLPTDPQDFTDVLDEIDSDEVSVEVTEPDLSIDKRVNGEVSETPSWRRAVPGEVLTFEVEVTNNGTSPAYDIEVVDHLAAHTAAGLGAVSAITNGGSFDPDTGLISWMLGGPLHPDASVTLTYQVELPFDMDPSDEVAEGPEYSNTAANPSYWGRPEAEREASPTISYREYTGGSDTVDIEVDLAAIGGVVWWDVNEDEVVDSAEPVVGGVKVSVIFAGADETFGTADDETFETVTLPDGTWEVHNLPGGLYTVEINRLDLPAGLISSVDRYDTVPAPDGSSELELAENASLGDVDFGHVGTGSVGDLVWLDQNLNGLRDIGEPGLDGVTLTLTWAGLDGDLATVDDNFVWEATTVDGLWAVSGLAAGTYRAEVDTTADSLYGMAAVYDLDGGDRTVAAFDLTSGQNRTDVDFGFAGSAVLGDLIYFDTNGDGSFDTATEKGIPGVVVELRWFGPDDTPNNADDGVFRTTTDANGGWLVTNLPPGTYQVTADATGLLASAAVTGDPDTSLDGVTELGLSVGEIFLDADFGYQGGLALGDTVWLDRNADGVQDDDEYGVGGVEVTLRWAGVDGNLDTSDDVVYQTTTDPAGSYLFSGLASGEYRITVGNLPAGTVLSFDPVNGTSGPQTSVEFSLTEPLLDRDFGLTGSIELSGTAWLDLNANGSQDDLDGWPEAGLEGRAIQVIWAGPDGDISQVDDNHIYYLSTDANGFYSLGGLPHGTYRVVATSTTADGTYLTYNPTDGVCGLADDCEPLVTLENLTSSVENIDFGVAGTGELGDLVYYDLARNGIFDEGVDVGIPGVGVTVSWQSGVYPDSTSHEFGTTTDAAGGYLFSNLPAGSYVVTVTTADLPVGMTQSADPDALFDATTTHLLTSGESWLQADFGFGGTNTLSGVVSYDTDPDVNVGYEIGSDHPVAAQQLTVTWAGPDGSFGTDDDYVFNLVTDAAGAWGLEDLPGGEYRVEVLDGITALADLTYNPSGALGDGAGFELVLGEVDSVDDVEFGFAGSSGFGDRVFIDRNSNGVEDTGEPGWPAVMSLLWHGPDGEPGTDDDIVFADVTTNTDGTYTQGGLPAGWFTVEVLNPPFGLGVTHNVAGDDSNLVIFELAPAEARTDIDFAYGGDASIGDQVFWDFDADGVFGDGDVGVPGADIRLTWAGPDGILGTGDDVTCDPEDASTSYLCATTNADGFYLVEHLPSGRYNVAFVNAPNGATVTTAPPAELDLAAGETFLEADFGFVGSARVGQRVWWDLNSNWMFDDDEPGLEGVEISFFWPGLDGLWGSSDDIVLHTSTDSDGWYEFGGLLPGLGEVHITSDLPVGTQLLAPSEGGLAVSGPDGFFYSFTLQEGDEVLSLDFPVTGDASLTGRVYGDLNGNQTEDAPEQGVPGVVVRVFWTASDGTEGSVLVTTDEHGDWALANLPAGTYQATVVELPASYGLTTPPTQQTVLSLAATAHLTHGIAPFVEVSGAVFVDTDRDGVFSNSEQGVPNVTVELLDADGLVVATAVTGPNGGYMFEAVAPGAYTVRADSSTLPDRAIWVSDPDAVIDGGHSLVVAGETVSGVNFGIVVEAVVDNVDDKLADTGPALAHLRWVALLAAVCGWLFGQFGRHRPRDQK